VGKDGFELHMSKSNVPLFFQKLMIGKNPNPILKKMLFVLLRLEKKYHDCAKNVKKHLLRSGAIKKRAAHDGAPSNKMMKIGCWRGEFPRAPL
jgi:hypothetical protein